MPIATNTGTRDVPLQFARALSNVVNEAWESGELLAKATPVTQDLLRFWFCEPFIDTRSVNFHEGQRQAILNTIYVHEILGAESVLDMYAAVDGDILAQMDLSYLKKDKFS